MRFGFFLLLNILSLSAYATDPLSHLQWGLKNTGQIVDEASTDIDYVRIRGVPGIDIQKRKSLSEYLQSVKREVRVAVIDSGLDITHPDLQGHLDINLADCDSLGRPPFQTEEDKDNNGYAGDCMGWNVSGSGDPNRVLDDIGHGTHVTGLIAAVENNKLGIVGIAPSVKILPIKLTHRGDKGQSYAKRLIKAFQYAIDRKVDLINLSLGWPAAANSEALQKKVQEALSLGIIIVAAAGNNTTDKAIYPCSYKEVICVGSIRPDGQLSQFSNFGSHVDILAPGSHILSLIPSRLNPTQFSVNGYDFKSGTSQAAPFVTGALALLKSILPQASNDELRARLLRSSQTRPRVDSSLVGLVQIDGALEARKQAAVYPILKGEQFISINDRLQFILPLSFKNYWQETSSVQVQVFSESGVTLQESEFELKDFEMGQEKSILLNGSVTNLLMSHVFRLRIRVLVGHESQDYWILRTMVQDSQNRKQEIFNLDLDLDEQALSKIQLSTVKNRFQAEEEPEYFFVTSKDEKTSFLYLLKQSGLRYQKMVLEVSKNETLLNFVKIDLDGDGQGDYLLQSFEKTDSRPTFKFWYLNSDLRPLYKQNFFVYEAEEAMPAWKNLGWVWSKYQNRKMLVPFFLAEGAVAKTGRYQDPFEETQDEAIASRLYYYVLDARTQRFVLYSFDVFRQRQNLLQASRAKGLEQISFLWIVPQSLADLKKGELKVLMMVSGNASGERYYELKVSRQAMFSGLKKIEGQFSLRGFVPVKKTGAGDLSEPFFMSRNQSADIIEFALLDGTQRPKFFSYKHQIKGDSIIGDLSATLDAGRVHVFVETKTNVVSVIYQPNGKTQTSTISINRSSVLSNSIFTDLFASIRVRDHLGLYVDSSQLYRGHVYALTTESDGGVVGRVENSFDVGEACQSLNPWVLKGNTKLTFFCVSSQAAKIYRTDVR